MGRGKTTRREKRSSLQETNYSNLLLEADVIPGYVFTSLYDKLCSLCLQYEDRSGDLQFNRKQIREIIEGGEADSRWTSLLQKIMVALKASPEDGDGPEVKKNVLEWLTNRGCPFVSTFADLDTTYKRVTLMEMLCSELMTERINSSKSFPKEREISLRDYGELSLEQDLNRVSDALKLETNQREDESVDQFAVRRLFSLTKRLQALLEQYPDILTTGSSPLFDPDLLSAKERKQLDQINQRLDQDYRTRKQSTLQKFKATKTVLLSSPSLKQLSNDPEFASVTSKIQSFLTSSLESLKSSVTPVPWQHLLPLATQELIEKFDVTACHDYHLSYEEHVNKYHPPPSFTPSTNPRRKQRHSSETTSFSKTKIPSSSTTFKRQPIPQPAEEGGNELSKETIFDQNDKEENAEDGGYLLSTDSKPLSKRKKRERKRQAQLQEMEQQQQQEETQA